MSSNLSVSVFKGENPRVLPRCSLPDSPPPFFFVPAHRESLRASGPSCLASPPRALRGESALATPLPRPVAWGSGLLDVGRACFASPLGMGSVLSPASGRLGLRAGQGWVRLRSRLWPTHREVNPPMPSIFLIFAIGCQRDPCEELEERVSLDVPSETSECPEADVVSTDDVGEMDFFCLNDEIIEIIERTTNQPSTCGVAQFCTWQCIYIARVRRCQVDSSRCGIG